MHSQPSGPPLVREDGDDNVMTSFQYGHVHERILLLREDYARNICHTPLDIPFRVYHHRENYIILLLIIIVVVVSVNFLHIKSMDRSEKIFVAITHTEH